MTTIIDIQLPFGEKFATQWESWLAYRKEIKKPYKSQKTIEGTLKKLTYYTEETACKMLQNSIDNGYQGIFEVKTENGKPVTGKEVYIPTPTHQLTEVQTITPDTNGVKEHARIQIEKFYQTGEINDLGNIIYDYLTKQGILKLSKERKEEISAPITYEANRKRNRTEEPYTGSLNAEIKREWLRTFLNENQIEL